MTPPPSPQIQQILNGFRQPIGPIERVESYWAKVTGASLVVLLLVGVYVLMLAFVFLFALQFLLGVLYSPSLFSLLVWGSLGMAMLAVFVAMTKPFFLRKEESLPTLKLHPQQEPVFFEFVKRICQTVGAPFPNEIVVDLQANAAAGFLKGPHDNQMRLMVGLPLVLGLDTRSLAGVLAHEFGHFNQTRGMRLVYYTNSILQVLGSAVYERDSVDLWIDQVTQTGGLFRLIGRGIQGVIFVARGFLWILFLIGHYAISGLSQQMEFDADRYEAQMAGSEHFAKTARRLQQLLISQAVLMDEMEHYRTTRRLPDNLPAMIVDGIRHIDPDKFREWEEKMLSVKTHWSDTHPADRERIENAAQQRAAGVYTIEQPSQQLFSDMPNLCRLLTERLYQRLLENDYNPRNLLATESLIETRSRQISESRAALRFVLDQFCGLDTFHVPREQLDTPMEPQTFVEKVTRMRQYLLEHGLTYTKLRIKENEIEEKLSEIVSIERLFQAGFELPDVVDGVRTQADAQQKRLELEGRRNHCRDAMIPYRKILGGRLLAALDFLQQHDVAQACGESPNVVAEIEQILAVWRRMKQLRGTLDQFAFEAQVNIIMLQLLGQSNHPQASATIRRATGQLAQTISQIQQSTVDLTYPFEHGWGKISVAKFLMPEPVKGFDGIAMLETACTLSNSIEYLLQRSVERLGALAEKVEQHFGLETLETPTAVQELLEAERAKREAASQSETGT